MWETFTINKDTTTCSLPGPQYCDRGKIFRELEALLLEVGYEYRDVITDRRSRRRRRRRRRRLRRSPGKSTICLARRHVGHVRLCTLRLVTTELETNELWELYNVYIVIIGCGDWLRVTVLINTKIGKKLFYIRGDNM